MVGYVCLNFNMSQITRIFLNLEPKTGLSVWFLVKAIGSS